MGSISHCRVANFQEFGKGGAIGRSVDLSSKRDMTHCKLVDVTYIPFETF